MNIDILSDNQLTLLKEFVSTEMLKRGYTAKITKFREVGGTSKRHSIEFETETFQTTPVMFKEIHLSNFSSGISLNTDLTLEHRMEIYDLYLDVSLNYEHFNGGTNGCTLFTLFTVHSNFEKQGRRLDNISVK